MAQKAVHFVEHESAGKTQCGRSPEQPNIEVTTEGQDVTCQRCLAGMRLDAAAKNVPAPGITIIGNWDEEITPEAAAEEAAEMDSEVGMEEAVVAALSPPAGVAQLEETARRVVGGKYGPAIQKLVAGEEVELEAPAAGPTGGKTPGATMCAHIYTAARKAGIKVKIRKVSDRRYVASRVVPEEVAQ